MKLRLLVLVSAGTALAASQGAGAQMLRGESGAPGDWEFRIGPVFTESKNVGFDGGSNADIKSTTGIKIGTGYYVSDHLIIGGNFSYANADFNGTVRGNNGAASLENGNADFSTLMFDATYTLLEGPIKPFGVAGVGWNWVHTNIATGPPQTGCWWDPWWGYVCSGYQPTHSSSNFAYQVGAGVKFNFSRQFAIDAAYKYTWIDLQHASSTPGSICSMRAARRVSAALSCCSCGGSPATSRAEKRRTRAGGCCSAALEHALDLWLSAD